MHIKKSKKETSTTVYILVDILHLTFELGGSKDCFKITTMSVIVILALG